jgi:hypothetical protein
MNELKIITVSGKSYLCEIESGSNLKLLNAKKIKGEIDQSFLKDYMKSKNIDKLKTIELSKTQVYTVEELDDDKKLQLDNLNILFDRAKKEAIKHLENSVFESLFKESFND